MTITINFFFYLCFTKTLYSAEFQAISFCLLLRAYSCTKYWAFPKLVTLTVYYIFSLGVTAYINYALTLFMLEINLKLYCSVVKGTLYKLIIHLLYFQKFCACYIYSNFPCGADFRQLYFREPIGWNFNWINIYFHNLLLQPFDLDWNVNKLSHHILSFISIPYLFLIVKTRNTILYYISV